MIKNIKRRIAGLLSAVMIAGIPCSADIFTETLPVSAEYQTSYTSLDNVILDYQVKYGQAVYNDTQLISGAYAQKFDFNNDGTDELLIVYGDDTEYYDAYYTVYAEVDGKISCVIEPTSTIVGSNIDLVDFILQDEIYGNYYIVNGVYDYLGGVFGWKYDVLSFDGKQFNTEYKIFRDFENNDGVEIVNGYNFFTSENSVVKEVKKLFGGTDNFFNYDNDVLGFQMLGELPGITVNNQNSNGKKYNSWQEAYYSVLRDISYFEDIKIISDHGIDDLHFDFIYLDNDDIPELAVYFESSHYVGPSILRYNSITGDVEYIWYKDTSADGYDIYEYGEFGVLEYIEKQGIIYDSEAGMGAQYMSVFSTEGSNAYLEESFSLYSEETITYYNGNFGSETTKDNIISSIEKHGLKYSETTSDGYMVFSGCQGISLYDSDTLNTMERRIQLIGEIPQSTDGDVNGDGAVTSDDALNVLQIATNIGEFTDAQKKMADVDGDGEITSMDALKILQTVVS